MSSRKRQRAFVAIPLDDSADSSEPQQRKSQGPKQVASAWGFAMRLSLFYGNPAVINTDEDEEVVGV